MRELDNITAEELIEKLKQQNIELYLSDGSLKFKASKGAMNQEILTEIKSRKADIINALDKIAALNDKSILFTPITPVAKKEAYPLSATQKRMFVLNKLDGESTAYNTTITLKINGQPNVKKLEEALKEIVVRHESLRTTFDMVNGEPSQIIHDSVEFEIKYEELNGNENIIEDEVKKFIKPYDLEKLPLFRLRLIKMADCEDLYFLIIDIHHIISDGVSAAIIIKEINALYNGEKLEPLTIHYKDYAAWHKKLLSSPLLKKEKEYWDTNFSRELPVLDMPCDYTRPAVFSSDGQSFHYMADKELTGKLKTISRENKATLFTVLLAAYNILLAKYSRQNDIIVGSPIAGRIHEDTYKLCGVFLNTLPLRNFPDDNKTCREFIREVAKNCLRAFDNQDYPFDKLVEDLNIERDSSRNPVFSTMFVMQNMESVDIEGSDFTSSRLDIKHKMAQVDITVNVTETNDGIDFEFNYCTALFKDSTIKAMTAHFDRILKLITEKPDLKIADINMMSEKECNLIINDFNNTSEAYKDVPLHALFEETAEKYPDNIAAKIENEEITYLKLNSMANTVTKKLIDRGVKPETIVGIICDPSIFTAAAILGILKAGGTYLPIKPDFPSERIEYMISDSNCKHVICDDKYKDKSNFAITKSEFNFDDCVENNVLVKVNANNLAYIIYTSGTTGKPKGVMIEHGSISKTIQWRSKEYQLKPGEKSLELFSYCFDGFLASFFPALSSGGCVVLLKKDKEKDPQFVAKTIIENKLTSLISVPMVFSSLISIMSADDMKYITRVTLAGDKTPAELIKRCKEKCPWIELVNEYGPTENSIVSTIKRDMSETSENVIGMPVSNSCVYILGKNSELLPIGIPGELCVSGERLARGYLGREDLTAEKFIANPFKKGERLYKTGDIAKWLPDGNIEFLGRIDFQVKIRGYRIETSEIEAALAKLDTVKDSAVIVKNDTGGNKYLCAYIVSQEHLDIKKTREGLLRSLPEYMIPAKFIRVDYLPLSTNGKLDRKALPEPIDNYEQSEDYKAPKSTTEKAVAAVWEEVLCNKNIGVNSNFFEVGGDSLSIVRLHNKLSAVYPDILTVSDLFTYSTIEKIAEYIDNYGNKNSTEPLNSMSKTKVENDDVAIIGISLNVPEADSLAALRKIVNEKRNCIKDMPEARVADAKNMLGKSVGESAQFERLSYLDEVDKFDNSFFRITPVEARYMDPNQRLLLETAYSAAEDAGYGGKALSGTKTGVYVGFCGDSEYGRFIADNEPESYSVAAAGNITSVIAGRVSYFLNLKGPAIVVNTACSSSLAAVHYACSDIQSGICDTAIVGGVKLWLDSLKDEFSMGIESKENLTKTFDDTADGTAKGEGVAAVMLKPLSKAMADGDSVYAVIKATSLNQDGTSNGLTAPDPAAQSKVIVDTWQRASINPETIGYIEAHGTGTKLGDPIEIDGLTKAFLKYTDKKQFCAVSSIKTNFGHTDNLAGVLSLIKAVTALKYKELPPSANFNEPNNAIDFVNSPVYVSDRVKPWKASDHPRRAGVSAFGLSGTNCHVLLEEAPENTKTPENGEYDIFTLSALTKSSLLKLVNKYLRYFDENEELNLHDVCFTVNTGRYMFEKRIAVIAKSIYELQNGLKKVKKSIDGNTDSDFPIVVSADMGLQSNNKQYKALYEIAEVFVKGGSFDFHKLYVGKNVKRVNAPSYVFDKKRFWVDIKAKKSPEQKDVERYYTVSWDEKPLNKETDLKNIIALYNKNSCCKKLFEKLQEHALSFASICLSDKFKKVSPSQYVARPLADDFISAFKDLNYESATIVYISTSNENLSAGIEELKGRMRESFTETKELINAIKKCRFKSCELIAVCYMASKALDNQNVINPTNSAVFGIINSIGNENPTIRCRCIDIDEITDKSYIAAEICSKFAKQQIAFRGGKRFEETLRPLYIDAVSSAECSIKDTGFYVVTGGVGRLGLAVGEALSLNKGINLALFTRKSEKELSQNEDIKEKIRKMNTSGANAFCVSCDITDYSSLTKAFDMLRTKYGRCNGIIHCAAVGVGQAQKAVSEENFETFESIISPKIYGTYLLDKVTRKDNPDFFVNFSSSITLLGGNMTSAYTAANAYLDSFCYQRRLQNLHTLTIDWPVFINQRQATKEEMRSLLFKPITVQDGVDDLLALLSKRTDRVVVGELNTQSDLLNAKLPFSLCDKLEKRKYDASEGSDESKRIVKLCGKPKNNYTETEIKIAQIWGEALASEEVSVNADFFENGGNSLVAIRLETCAENHGIQLSPEDIYKYPTIEKMAAYIDGKSLNATTTTTYDEVAVTDIREPVSQIDNIEPFNEIFYRNCFFNSFFPIVRHYNLSIKPILANGLPVLSFYNDELKVDYLSCEPLEKVIGNIGITFKSFDYDKDLNKRIIDAVDNKKPSIVWVDCFYEPLRKDLYEKEHWAHTILIYGYDDSKSEFLVIEHSVRENLSYERKRIEYNDLINMCRGYDENFKESVSQPCLTVYDRRTMADCDDYSQLYINTCKKFYNKSTETIELIKLLAEVYVNAVADEDLFKAKSESLLNLINDILNALKAEQFTVKEVIGENAADLQKLSSEIIEAFSQTRRILARCIYKNEFNEEKLKSQLNTLDNINNLFLNYYKLKKHILNY